MTKTKVQDLTGPELAVWVARAQGWKQKEDCLGLAWYKTTGNKCAVTNVSEYRPDLNWSQCGELVERFRVNVTSGALDWSAYVSGFISREMTGPTPLIAICRAAVAKEFGEYVEESE